MIMNKKRKMGRADRRLLKKAGFGREFKEMGALACAPEDVKNAPHVPGYALAPDSGWGRRTRRRLRRERWNRRARCVRRMLLYVLVYGASLAAVLLLVGAVYELLRRWLM